MRSFIKGRTYNNPKPRTGILCNNVNALSDGYKILKPDSRLIFRGGTCIGKVYADFYRLNENLDFMISTPPEANISVRQFPHCIHVSG
ncbi:MAG: nucleotidyl transferase AbiEii/AbiGii toxin family protein [Proteobacteria bacterium]|nr:nucleotidyl transferase AbiEii/AbiGii toxin family protein [Pseudomonadota bacterium]